MGRIEQAHELFFNYLSELEAWDVSALNPVLSNFKSGDIIELDIAPTIRETLQTTSSQSGNNPEMEMEEKFEKLKLIDGDEEDGDKKEAGGVVESAYNLLEDAEKESKGMNYSFYSIFIDMYIIPFLKQ